MRTIIAVVLMLLANPATAALLHGSGSSSACRSGSPSPDGSAIFPPGPTCILTDREGITWQYNGGNLVLQNGAAQGHQSIEMLIADFGYAFQLAQPNGCPYQLWGVKQYGDGLVQSNQTLSGTPLAPVTIARTGVSYLSIGAADGYAQPGDTFNFAAMPSGVPISLGGGRINVSNITITFASGAILGCAADLGNAAIPVDMEYGAISNLTINNGEIAYVQDTGSGSFRAINIAYVIGFTLNGTYIHDSDMGLLGSGDNGTVSDHAMTGWDRNTRGRSREPWRASSSNIPANPSLRRSRAVPISIPTRGSM